MASWWRIYFVSISLEMFVVHTLFWREWDNLSSCDSLPDLFAHYVSLLGGKHQFIYFYLFAHWNQKTIACLRSYYLLSHNWMHGIYRLYVDFARGISLRFITGRYKRILHLDLIFVISLFHLFLFFFLLLKRKVIYVIDLNNDLSYLFDILRLDWSNLLHAFKLIVFKQISEWVLHKDYSFDKSFNIKLM